MEYDMHFLASKEPLKLCHEGYATSLLTKPSLLLTHAFQTLGNNFYPLHSAVIDPCS
ncbi:unnamed protein product [Camellia sinensis]